jgi:hypothetical protein
VTERIKSVAIEMYTLGHYVAMLYFGTLVMEYGHECMSNVVVLVGFGVLNIYVLMMIIYEVANRLHIRTGTVHMQLMMMQHMLSDHFVHHPG